MTRPVERSEASIEAAIVKRLEKYGCRALKFNSAGRRAVPDRMVLMRNGLVFFLEIKRPGQRSTPLQRVEQQKLECPWGYYVAEVHSTEEAVQAFHEARKHYARFYADNPTYLTRPMPLSEYEVA